jgi:uncharacterized protein
VIVVDTTVLVYAVGVEQPLREHSRRLLRAAAEDELPATTTAEVIQEFAHVRARRRGRKDAASLARSYAQVLSPLLTVRQVDVERGLDLFEEHSAVGAFDAVLAASAIAAGARALVSSDRAFAAVPELPYLGLGTRDLEELLAG